MQYIIVHGNQGSVGDSKVKELIDGRPKVRRGGPDDLLVMSWSSPSHDQHLLLSGQRSVGEGSAFTMPKSLSGKRLLKSETAQLDILMTSPWHDLIVNFDLLCN